MINCGLTTFSDKVFDILGFFQFHLMHIYFYLNIFIIHVKNGLPMDFISHLINVQHYRVYVYTSISKLCTF